MSYYRICPNCGKGTTVRYEYDDSLCGECSDNSASIDKLSVEKLIENEIGNYEKSYKISGPRSENYIAGILEGLKIARAHVIDSLSTDEKTDEKLQEENNELRNEIARLSQQTQHSEPKLTIPQNIADMAYKYRDATHLSYSKTVWEWIQTSECKEKAEALIQAYLAGKALGVDLVKVVEDE